MKEILINIVVGTGLFVLLVALIIGLGMLVSTPERKIFNEHYGTNYSAIEWVAARGLRR